MTQNERINAFVEYDGTARRIIEPKYRHEFVDAALRRVFEKYNPASVVKAGVGAGELLLTIAEKASACVCIEPSFEAIERFKKEYSGDPRSKKIQFVNGHFFAMPLDYFKVDLLVCVDYFDFILSAFAMEEFKRTTQFEGLFFFGGVVLSDEDIEGTYDELIRMINPLHNDYYLPGDLKTYMQLKDYTDLSDSAEIFRLNIKEYTDYWMNTPLDEKKPDSAKVLSFIDENKDLFKKLYALDENYSVNEIYCTALFKKNKFKETPSTL